jgi:hypothetical protein
MAQRKGRHAKPQRKKRRACPPASSSGSPRGPSTVTQAAGGGGKRGPREEGRRPVADGRGRRPDSSSSGTPAATLASIALFRSSPSPFLRVLVTLLPLVIVVVFGFLSPLYLNPLVISCNSQFFLKKNRNSNLRLYLIRGFIAS